MSRYDHRMKRRPPLFVPSPIAWISAALLYVLLVLLGAAAAVLVPLLLEVMRSSPRLAMLGFLGLAVSPAFVVVVVHHFGHRSLDGFDRPVEKAPAPPSLRSWWAGAHAWLVLYGTSVVTSLVMLVIDPPEPEPDAYGLSALLGGLTTHATLSNALSLRTMIWVAIAALLYELERRAHARSTD